MGTLLVSVAKLGLIRHGMKRNCMDSGMVGAFTTQFCMFTLAFILFIPLKKLKVPFDKLISKKVSTERGRSEKNSVLNLVVRITDPELGKTNYLSNVKDIKDINMALKLMIDILTVCRDYALLQVLSSLDLVHKYNIYRCFHCC